MNIKLPLIASAFCLSFGLNAQNGKVAVNNSATQTNDETKTHKRGCGTEVPGASWDAWFNEKVNEFKAANPNGKAQAVNYTIPVVVHVIHGGQSVGIYPNLTQAQINSQITVLNADFAGTGFNSGNVPAPFASAKANTGITFCLALKDPNGATLTEPGIDRISYVAKGWNNPASTSYNTPSSFQTFINGTVKPGSIWDPTRYLNIWITDENPNAGLLGFATFPSGSGLTGIPGGTGTSLTDGVWVFSGSFGSKGIYGAGIYSYAQYQYGRTATHEIGHWVGLRHIGGDGNNNVSGDCNATDYCNDTPPQKGGFLGGQYGQNFGGPAYPLHPNVCANPDGDQFMNFMDYVDDAYCYMFSNDQSTRIQTAMTNGTYRSQLGASSATMCGIAPVASFSVIANECALSEITPVDQSTGSATLSYTWSTIPSASVTINGGSTATPTIVFPSAGTYSVKVDVSNAFGLNSQTNVVQINACVGIKENSVFSNNIRLIPNPSSGLVNVVTTLPNSQSIEISIHNALGQVIATSKHNAVTNNMISIDLNNYSNGVYFVTINNGQEKVVKRLILSK